MNMGFNSFILTGFVLVGFLGIISWINHQRVRMNEEVQEIKIASEYPWDNNSPEGNIFDPDPVEVPDSLSRDLNAYKMLFEAKINYLEEIVNKKFEKNSISWNKYTDLIEKSRTAFVDEITSANRMLDLNILINESDISEMYEEKIENINKIIKEVEELMIEFIKSEYKPDGDNLKRLLEEIEYCKKGVDMYVQE